MEKHILQKYRLLYMLLVKEFVAEVERGTEWMDLQPLLKEMKRLDECMECAVEIALDEGMQLAAAA